MYFVNFLYLVASLGFTLVSVFMILDLIEHLHVPAWGCIFVSSIYLTALSCVVKNVIVNNLDPYAETLIFTSSCCLILFPIWFCLRHL